jgi:hypothetical protein
VIIQLTTGPPPLYHLSYEVDPKDHSFHKNQIILGQQLIRHGANATFDKLKSGQTPLHLACHSRSVTNLDFIQLLLEKGASPNVQDIYGRTPLMSTIPMAPGAAKFLLEWSTPPTTDIDIHISDRTGATLLDMVRSTIEDCSDQNALPDHPDQQVKYTFLIQQCREIETMLLERGSH